MTNTPPTTPPPSKTTGGPRNIPPPPQVSASREAIFDSRFRVIDRLASSGSATVYLCEDLTLRSRAAVKVLNTADAEMRQRFLEEATLLANVRHPHLVQVLSAGELADGSPYIAMEDLGENLDRRLRDGEPLSWREVVQVALQVAAALQVLHKAGVIHRDVKPSNIAQVQGENGQVFVKLIDLGIARAEDLASVQQGGDELPTREGTLEGVALGTPGFMPPEAGLCVPTPGFDVYALGASIFLLCTGELHNPIEPRTMQEVRPEIEIPVELEAVVMRALAVIPEERIASAAAFSRQLTAVQTTEGFIGPMTAERGETSLSRSSAKRLSTMPRIGRVSIGRRGYLECSITLRSRRLSSVVWGKSKVTTGPCLSRWNAARGSLSLLLELSCCPQRRCSRSGLSCQAHSQLCTLVGLSIAICIAAMCSSSAEIRASRIRGLCVCRWWILAK